jgi:hypothetical protein
MRVLIAVAIDWRFVLALVFLVLLLLVKQHNLPGGMHPSGSMLILPNRPNCGAV